MRPFALACQFAFVAWLGACAAPMRPTLRPAAPLNASQYEQVLDLWTRKGTVYAGLVEHKMTAKGTLITPMFRQAFAAKFPEIYGYGSQVTRRELVELGGKAEESVNFFFSVYTPKDKWNDLHKPESIWHVTIRRVASEDAPDEPGQGADAVSIERVKIDENLRTVYPHLTAFDEGYVVRFPPIGKDDKPLLGDGASYLRVRIASSFGAVAMTWTVLSE